MNWRLFRLSLTRGVFGWGMVVEGQLWEGHALTACIVAALVRGTVLWLAVVDR